MSGIHWGIKVVSWKVTDCLGGLNAELRKWLDEALAKNTGLFLCVSVSSLFQSLLRWLSLYNIIRERRTDVALAMNIWEEENTQICIIYFVLKLCEEENVEIWGFYCCYFTEYWNVSVLFSHILRRREYTSMNILPVIDSDGDLCHPFPSYLS